MPSAELAACTALYLTFWTHQAAKAVLAGLRLPPPSIQCMCIPIACRPSAGRLHVHDDCLSAISAAFVCRTCWMQSTGRSGASCCSRCATCTATSRSAASSAPSAGMYLTSSTSPTCLPAPSSCRCCLAPLAPAHSPSGTRSSLPTLHYSRHASVLSRAWLVGLLDSHLTKAFMLRWCGKLLNSEDIFGRHSGHGSICSAVQLLVNVHRPVSTCHLWQD